MSDTQVAKKEQQAAAKGRKPETDVICLPDVDITETEAGVRLLADMPGADQDSVDVTVENNVLTIEGRVRIHPPEGHELIGEECGAGRYRRDFALSDEIDTEAVKARMRHGVLEVTLPKRESAETRKIAIET